MLLRLCNAIFDLDGTLVDSAGDIRAAIAESYAAVGINVTDGLVGKIEEAVIGPPLPEMLRELTPELSETRQAAVVAAFRRAYDGSPLTRTVVYPGVWGVLRRLRELGAIILLATNKPLSATRRVLQKTALDGWLLDVATPECSSPSRANKAEMVGHLVAKWRLEPATTFVIGDSASDVEAAHRNGLGSIALASGYGNRVELAGSRPTLLLQCVEELLAYLGNG